MIDLGHCRVVADLLEPRYRIKPPQTPFKAGIRRTGICRNKNERPEKGRGIKQFPQLHSSSFNRVDARANQCGFTIAKCEPFSTHCDNFFDPVHGQSWIDDLDADEIVAAHKIEPRRTHFGLRSLNGRRPQAHESFFGVRRPIIQPHLHPPLSKI
ncbi:MAG TPA: hypothetical protein VFS63_07525 [Pseudolabrys sp.]|nr:hypothetical protein [Pseudolabrys sp.]